MFNSDWLTQLTQAQQQGTPLLLDEQPLAGTGRALSLAPHPDDPEAIAVTLRLLVEGGWQLSVAVATPAWSGVQDDYVGPDPREKARVREEEQRAALRLFGLPEEELTFLRLGENAAGDLDDTPENHRRFDEYLDAIAPDLLLCPNGEDSNPSHRLVHAWALTWARQQGRPVIILGNEDPKSTCFRPDLQITFGEETATWKATLLECHRSQSIRNQRTRGITFAQRILAVNRQADGRYAERFQIMSNCV